MSMWPAMIAGPSSPGVGPPVYHPAGKALGGTSIDPSVRRPRCIRAESTPIAPICRRTGEDLARGTPLTMRDRGDGATAAPIWLRQPTAPMVVVANRAATITITLARASRGRLLLA